MIKNNSIDLSAAVLKIDESRIKGIATSFGNLEIRDMRVKEDILHVIDVRCIVMELRGNF